MKAPKKCRDSGKIRGLAVLSVDVRERQFTG
ncbi:hypothetical protein ABH917_001147 [Thermobifida halotolerans]